MRAMEQHGRLLDWNCVLWVATITACGLLNTAWAQDADPVDEGNTPTGNALSADDPFSGSWHPSDGTDDPFSDADDDPFDEKQQRRNGGRARSQHSDAPRNEQPASRPHQNRAEVKKRMNSLITFEFFETPIEEAMDFLQQAADLAIEIDTQALEHLGLDESLPVTAELRSVRIQEGAAIHAPWTRFGGSCSRRICPHHVCGSRPGTSEYTGLRGP